MLTAGAKDWGSGVRLGRAGQSLWCAEAAVDRLETCLSAELPELAGDGETLKFQPQVWPPETSPDVARHLLGTAVIPSWEPLV